MKKKSVLYISVLLVSVLLSILSNAIWEYLGKPLFNYFGLTIFKLVTLGNRSFQNQVFLEIAKNHHEDPQIKIYSLFIWFCLFGIFYATYQGWSLFKKTKEQQKLIENCADSLCKTCPSFSFNKVNSVSSTKVELNELNKKLPGLKKMALTVSMLQTFLAIFYFVFLSLSFIKTSLVNIYVTRFNQYITIVKPYIDEIDLNKINSSFALIKNEKDYNKIMKTINEIARKNQITESMLP